MFMGKDRSERVPRPAPFVGPRCLERGYGRFVQADPIGYDDGMNLYRYAGNDPINFSDPSGTRLRYACAGFEGSVTCGWKDDGTPTLHASDVVSVSSPGAPVGEIGVESSEPQTVQSVCPSGVRHTFSDSFGFTGFLFSRGISLNVEVGLAIPETSWLRGAQSFLSVNIVGLGGRGLFGGAGESLGAGYDNGPLSSGYSQSSVVQGGAAWGAGGEGSYTYGGGNAASISGGPKAGAGAYIAAGDKHSLTVATPQIGC